MNHTPDAGHAAHSQPAQHPGLPGSMQKPVKVAFIGAGSFFCLQLAKDLMLIPNNRGGEIAMVDTDSRRLERMRQLVESLTGALPEGKLWKVTATTRRQEALPLSDYLVNSIEVSGLDCVGHDNDIPRKYGIDQCIGDTIGPGGVMKALRTGPVWLDILRDAQALCPEALILNYTNPMNILCLAAFRAFPRAPLVGLCHSVQGTSKLLASYAGVPYEELEWNCAGINHLAWFTRLRHSGRNLYPQLFDKFRPEVDGRFASRETKDERKRDLDLVRKDMALRFGAFITESSGHLSEYLPYYRKSPEILKRYARERYHGESGFYARNWPHWRQAADREREQMIRGEKELPSERSWEYGSWIVEAREKNAALRIHANVYNLGDGVGSLISNLPADGCVEVATLVDRNGFQPCRFGALPPQMAAVCASNMAVFDLAATAIVERSLDAATHAMMLDPLTAAVLAPAQIEAMARELFEAEKDFLSGYH